MRAQSLPVTPQAFRSEKSALLARAQGLAHPREVRPFLRELSQLTDEALRALWRDLALPPTLALVAVGGYGRGELFPSSDVDVLILLPNDCDPEADPTLKSSLERFISQCWDQGLEIGSSVRTLNECLHESKHDITIQTALLESRCLCGSAELFAQFAQGFAKAMDAQAFFVAKQLEMQQRHTKHANTPYALEPNCKESPGGMRDLQVIRWVCQAAGLGGNWKEMARKGLANAFEARQLQRHEDQLGLIRIQLHLAAKRREDRLVFDLQHAVAKSLGLGTGEDGAFHARQASEALMRTYYWTAKAVTQLNQILMLNIEAQLHGQRSAPVAINARFLDRDGLIEVAHDQLYLAHPEAILETFWLFQNQPGIKGLSARTLRALYNARPVMDGRFRSDPANRAMFLRILQSPRGITHAMRLMNQTSVLGRYLWVFRRIVGQMQHDLFHVYTVDQHILMVLRNVRRFFIAEHAHEYPFCSQLASGWDQPWILYTAALFHDIAKGRGGDHSDLGAVEARKFCRQHGVGRAQTDLIAFLVAEHLSMSQVAQKQDLSDPEVIRAFARRVGDERRLTALYLLTVADIRGTSPKVWNAWKGKLLEDLYRFTLRVLGGREPDAMAEVETRKREALTQLALHALPFEAEKGLWSTLDVSYFMRHDAADIAWHTRQLSRVLADAHKQGQPVSPQVRARVSPLGEGLQVMVYTADQPDLFARICGYFDQAGFNILDARIHTASNGYALDTFQVVSWHEEHHREWIQMVEQGLTQTIAQAGALPTPGRGRVSRRVKSFPMPARVTLQPDERGQRWLLTISASDRIGLLYRIARVLAQHKVNLHLAKVSTLGERVEDTFLIDGAALQGTRSQIDLETELLDAVQAD